MVALSRSLKGGPPARFRPPEGGARQLKSYDERCRWLTELILRVTEDFGVVVSAAKVKVAAAGEAIFEDQIMADSVLRQVLASGALKTVDPAPDVGTLARLVAAQTVANAEKVMAAACIVLAHSIVDDIFTECCLLAIECDPNGWVHEIDPDRKLSLRDLKSKGEKAVMAQELEKLGRQLGGKALPNRAEILFRHAPVAHQPTIATTDPRYFRLSTLKELDGLRHGVVHRGGLTQLDAALTIDRVAFLLEAAATGIRSVSNAYHVGADRDHLAQLLAARGKGEG